MRYLPKSFYYEVYTDFLFSWCVPSRHAFDRFLYFLCCDIGYLSAYWVFVCPWICICTSLLEQFSAHVSNICLNQRINPHNLQYSVMLQTCVEWTRRTKMTNPTSTLDILIQLWNDLSTPSICRYLSWLFEFTLALYFTIWICFVIKLFKFTLAP